MFKRIAQISRKSRKRACAFLTLVIFFDIVVFALFPLEEIDELISLGKLPSSSIPIAVLFHGYTKDRKEIDKETKRRINFGISLFRQLNSAELIFSGGKRSPNNRTGAALMAEYAAVAEVPNGSIHTEDASYDSKSNLENINKWNKKQDRQPDVVLVSSPFHLMRIASLNKKNNARIYYVPYLLHRASPPISRFELWTSAHYNFFIYFANKILPIKFYDCFVLWMRNNTFF